MKGWRWEEDGYTVTRGGSWSGPGCHNGCGVLLYTKDGKLVKVEGDPENPYNQGRLCVRCLALPDVVNHPDRLKYPMKRAGKRGENKWERITWEEAYDTIVARLNKVKEEYGAESVIFCRGTGRDIGFYLGRLASSFGSPNHVGFLSGQSCYLPRVAGLVVTSGCFWVADYSQCFPDRYDNPDWKVPECVIIWGNNPVVANSDGALGGWVVDCMKRGTKLIVIDPRLTWLASRAELWLQIRPGTDAALALGMLDIIIKEELYDKEFVDKWTYGFDKLAERAAEYPVERVAEITWIPKEKIIAAARMYARSKPAPIQWGVAVDMTKESLPACQAISSLWTVTGNLDVPGGMVPPPTFMFHGATWGAEFLGEEQKAKCIGVDKYPLLKHGFQTPQSDMVVDTLHTGDPYPIKAAWIQTSNPITCMGQDPKKIYDGLRKLDFVVVVDLFMTPTAVALADIVLPAATYPERDGLVFGDGAQRGLTINKAVEVGEAKSDMQINLEVGKRFNPEAWPWQNVQEMFSTMLEGTSLDMTFQELREAAPVYPPFEYKKYEKGKLRPDGKPGFRTPTGKVELYSTGYEEMGLDPLPYFEEPTESPYSTPELCQEYPLILTTGRRPWCFFHSEHRQVSKLRAIHPEPQIEVHPETAARYGIEDGDWVWIENRMGKCRQRAKLTPITDPRVVHAEHAWWFPEKPGAEPSLFGMWEVNINQLVPLLPGRSGFGTNTKSLICKIYKAAEGNMGDGETRFTD